jgi:hypothetical protein
MAPAIGEFWRCGFMANAPGPATRLTVTVKTPATAHEVRLSKIEAWLESGGSSPNEQALKLDSGRRSDCDPPFAQTASEDQSVNRAGVLTGATDEGSFVPSR